MTDLRETDLPGVGVRYDLETRYGGRIAVLVHRTGRRDLIVYAADDPDECAVSVTLGAEDAAALGEALGPGPVARHVSGMQQDVAGLAIDWIEVAPEGAWAGRTLGEAEVHSTTGVSIVAVIRGSDTIPAPGAATVLLPGDTVVAVGTADGLADVARRLQGK